MKEGMFIISVLCLVISVPCYLQDIKAWWECRHGGVIEIHAFGNICKPPVTGGKAFDQGGER